MKTPVKKTVYLLALNEARTRFAAYIDHKDGAELAHVWPKFTGPERQINDEALAQGFSLNSRYSTNGQPKFFINALKVYALRGELKIDRAVNEDEGASWAAREILRLAGETGPLEFVELNGGATRPISLTLPPKITPVVLRRFRDYGDLIALFPTIDEGHGTCSSYQTVGQHGAAHYAGVIETSNGVSVSDADAAALLLELTRIGYTPALTDPM